MRQVAASRDPDAPARVVTLPSTWDDTAAAALAALIPGDGPVNLCVAAQGWITRVAAGDAALEAELHALLLARRATAAAPLWAGDFSAPGFVLNAAGFYDPAGGFDLPGFAAAAESLARAAISTTPGLSHYPIGLSGLDDLLARLGLAYDSAEARSTAAALAALLRASVERGLDGEQLDLLAATASWPWPPVSRAIPGLTEAARAARSSLLRAPGAATGAGIYPASPADALLGIETAGLAPAFLLAEPGANGRPSLTQAARARLAARGMAPDAALAAALMGETVLEIADLAAHWAMHDALAPFLASLPARPTALPSPAPAAERAEPQRGPLPPRHASTMRKVSIAGHRVFLRTGDYEDGRVGEIALTLPGENALVRGLAESFAQAVTLGLQFGVPVGDFVEALAMLRFGPAGRVEGDEGVSHAASIVDYVMRSLAAHYLGQRLPPPQLDDPEAVREAKSEPLLPLELPAGQDARARRSSLRVVA